MCEPSIEELVTFLSTKFNKIFCDREFVCCVSSDFHVLKNKRKCRVLVFPTLGPVYQRALKYQAEAFDFATFELPAGIFKIIAVCQKEHILRKQKEDLRKRKHTKMSSESSNSIQDAGGRKKRPERQLYVPPAQRRLTSTKETEIETKRYKQSLYDSSDVKISKIPTQTNTKKQSNSAINKKKSSSRLNGQNKEVITETIDFCGEENISDGPKSMPSLLELMKLDLLSLPKYNVVFLKNSIPSFTSFHDCFCEFHQYLNTNYNNHLKLSISIFHLNDNDDFETKNDKIYWWTFFPHNIPDTPRISNETFPTSNFTEFNFSDNLTVNQMKLCSRIQMRYSSERSIILYNENVNDSSEVDIIFKEKCAISDKLSCDSELFENIVDLTEFNLGHYFKIESGEEDHFYICNEKHDIRKCYAEVKRDLLSKAAQKREEEERLKKVKSIPNMDHKSIQSCTKKKKEPEVIKISEVESKPAKIETKKIRDSKKKCQHDEEIEIMRKTKENINRKTRPLMKYSDESDDLLKIGKQDNVNNWEDLFDEEGQIQEELLTRIVHKVGKDMTIVKASEDYTPYMPKPTQDLDHVLEIYNFTPSLTTGDIIHAFGMFDPDSMYVVWLNDTHALLVLGSAIQAQRALEVKNPFIKVRPLSSGSVAAMTAASQYDLKPAMKRPQTNLQTARRLITTHLGTKSRVSKEQTEMERENLRKAREQKKLVRQSQRDAWEGNIH
ncbi:uncharacterized protein LOC123685716 [Harmonia axyridis]|uniref:uncharacterized protein LOC123685716 n=1 Tax=Harmonia axyridis TaxID=115357 RepID=UPI001E278665|nr:uncharacterized protein LOC123685716 [Harmonia axyridis]